MAQTLVEIDSNTQQATCERCGYVFQFNSRYLYGRNYDATLCADCKARPVKTVKRNGRTCVPWDGEFDLDTFQPLKDGVPYLPGTRTCGNADCVLKSHVIPTEAKSLTPAAVPSSVSPRKKYKVRPVPTQLERLIAEQNDISYRTGRRRRGYTSLMRALEKERAK